MGKIYSTLIVTAMLLLTACSLHPTPPSDGSSEALASFDAASTRYEPTAWDAVKYPDYVRVDGPAIGSDQAPAAGTIEYGGIDEQGRTLAATGTITYQMVEKSRGWRQEFSDDADDMSGWGHNAKVTIDLGDGKSYRGYLYNRSHLIADSLGGDASRHNLVCGTRTQNVGKNDGQGGMAYTETLARDWLNAHHDGTVYYKATPVYVESEIVPRSVYVDIKTSDGTIDQHVEVFNCAAGYEVDYLTGSFKKNG